MHFRKAANSASLCGRLTQSSQSLLRGIGPGCNSAARLPPFNAAAEDHSQSSGATYEIRPQNVSPQHSAGDAKGDILL